MIKYVYFYIDGVFIGSLLTANSDAIYATHGIPCIFKDFSKTLAILVVQINTRVTFLACPWTQVHS